MEVMLVGATRGVFLAVDRMSKTKGGEGGRIINTASMAGVSVSFSQSEIHQRLDKRVFSYFVKRKLYCYFTQRLTSLQRK